MATQSYYEGLERYLREARVEDDPLETVVQGAHGPKDKLMLEGGIPVILKPNDGSSMKQAAVNHEEAAWILARELGWTSLVAPTVQRKILFGDGREVRGSVQILWPNPTPEEQLPAVNDFPEGDVWRAAIFDWLIHNTDHTHNYAAAPKDVALRRLRLYDNAYAFEYQTQKPGSVFFDAKEGEEVPNALLEDVKRAFTSLKSSGLSALLGEDAMTMLGKRMEDLVKKRRLTADS